MNQLISAGRRAGVARIAAAAAAFAIGFLGVGPTATGAHASGVSGRSIVYLSTRTGDGNHHEVDAIDPSGRHIRQLVRDADGATWSPDGRKLAFLREVPTTDPSCSFESDLYVVRAGGRGVRRLATNALSMSWAPDSSTIAFLRQSNCKGQREIWSVEVASGKLRKLTSAPTPPYSLAWSPRGSQMAFVEFVNGEPADLSLMSADGTKKRQISIGDIDGSFGWAPDGERLIYGLVYRGGVSQSFRIVDVRTGRVCRLELPRGIGDPTWSPDGKWIAFGGVHGLLLVKPDGKDLRQLTSSSYAAAPAWSPDSKNVAIEQGDLWVVPIDGSRPRRVTQGWRYGTDSYSPQWQPAGVPVARLWGPYISPAFPSDSLQVGNVLETTHPVSRLAADGSRAALVYDPGQGQDPYSRFSVRTEVWNPASRAIRVLGDGCEGGGACFGLAIAGDRVAELFIEPGFTRLDSIGLRTGTLAVPRMTTGFVCDRAASCLGVPIDDLLGSGSLLVFDTWDTPCQLSHAGCTGRPKTNGRLYRLDGSQVVQIAAGTGALTPLSVDAGRILVDHEDGTMEIRTADGTVLRSFTFDEASVRAARLQGNDLVVQTPTSIEVTDATTGLFQRRWPLPTPDATLTDLQNGVVVLVAGTDIHLLRVSDGADSVIHTPGGGPVLAELEPSGLFYSYTADDSKYPGRVVFVPFDRLPLH